MALIHEARFPIGGLLVGCPTGFCGSRRGGMLLGLFSHGPSQPEFSLCIRRKTIHRLFAGSMLPAAVIVHEAQSLHEVLRCPTRAFSTRRAPRLAPNTYRVSADHGTDVRPEGGLPYSVGGGWTSRFATPRCDAAHLRSAPSSSWLEEVSQGHRGASITQEWRIVEVHGRELNAAPEADRSCACHPYGGSVTLGPYLCRKMR